MSEGDGIALRPSPDPERLTLGLVIIIAAVVAWYWVAAFGRGMNTTGCRDVRIPMPWEDPELFGMLGPFFGLGVVVFVLGSGW